MSGDTKDIRTATEADLRAFAENTFASGIAKVLLVNPPDADAAMFRFDTAKRGRYTNYPPYGLLVIAENLRAIGVEVAVCNLNDEILMRVQAATAESGFNFDEIWQTCLDREIAAFDPDLVGVTCMFSMTHQSFKKVCERAGAGKPVAIGGVHVSGDFERILEDVSWASMAFLRECDTAFGTFVRYVNGDAEFGEVGQMVIAGREMLSLPRDRRPSAHEINIIPAYDLIDISRYSEHGTIGAFYCFKPEGTKFASVLSNRGCRAQCSFCSVRNFNGAGVRQRDIASVADELEVLENEYGIGHVMWLDDDLFKDHGRAIALFNEIVRRKLTLTWDATNGVLASSCTEEVIAAAAESGCIALNIGMESGNPEILRSVRKPATVDTYLAAAQVLGNYEQIHSSVFLMVGFPGETMAQVIDTVNVATEMDLDWYRISQLQPLPNTPIYDAMVAQGMVQEAGSKNVRFNGGAFGKQTEIEQGLSDATPDFAKAFSGLALDQVPGAEALTDIWFFMNYQLNFHRIFNETRPVKIGQLVAHLNVLADVISPENAFALYFLGYLQHKTEGRIDAEMIRRLDDRLATSAYWQDRFDAFGLSIDHLRDGQFGTDKARDLLPRTGLPDLGADAPVRP